MSIKLKGSTGGSVSWDAPSDTSPSGTDVTLTLPTSAGSAGQYLRNSGTAGTLEFGDLSGVGKILQVVNVTDATRATGTTLFPLDNTKPQNTEGTEFMTLAITPTSSTSKLLVSVEFQGTASPSNTIIVALFQDSTADALAATLGFAAANNASQALFLNHYMTAGTTSETTFKVRAGNISASTVIMNGDSTSTYFGGASSSSITIMEIAA